MSIIRRIKNTIRTVVGEERYAHWAVMKREFLNPKRRFSEASFLDLFDVETHKALAIAVHYVYSCEVDGDFAEFGTYLGRSAQTIAISMAAMEKVWGERGTRRTLNLFDSFEGLPEFVADADRTATQITSGTWYAGHMKGLSEGKLKRVCSDHLPASQVKTWAGWFADTAAAIPSDVRFAFIHFDGDLYQSTLDAFRPLFARGQISEGATILFDDWDCSRASPNYGERRAWRELVEEFSIQFSDWGSYAIGHRFIIHSYKRS